MKYIAKGFAMIWNALSIFFGFPYEKQARKMKDYDLRGKDNPKNIKGSYKWIRYM